MFDLQDGWFDCWTAPSIQLDITFLYHPIPLSGPPPQAEISTPEKESKLLSPLRVPTKSATRTSLKALIDSFDPAMMEADKCTVVLKVETSTAYLYGTLIRTFMHVKENLCGEDLVFTPMDVVTSSTAGKNIFDKFSFSIRFHYFNTIGLTNLSNARYCNPYMYLLNAVSYTMSSIVDRRNLL